MKKIIVSDEAIEQLVDEQLCAFVKKHFYDTYCNRREEMGYSEHQASEAVLMEFQLNFERKIRKAAINLIMHETIYRLSQEHGEEGLKALTPKVRKRVKAGYSVKNFMKILLFHFNLDLKEIIE